MSERPNSEVRPEQGWTAVIAVSAALPPLALWASLQDWSPVDAGAFAPLFVLAGPLCLGYSFWALVRALRTLRSWAGADRSERLLAALASVIAVPVIVGSAMAVFAITAYVVGGGGG